MAAPKMEKAMRPIPVPYDEVESFPKHVEEFFDLIARRPFELLEKTPLLEHLLKTEPALARPIFLKLYETEEHLIARAEVPGYTEKELNVVCEPWRMTITGKKEYKEEGKTEEMRLYEKTHIFKSIKFPLEVRPENVKAVLKNGILEMTIPKAAVAKKVEIEVKPF